MAQDPRKTVPMPKREAKDLTSMRRTERMGIERDTIRDLPGSAESAKNLPRGTVPMAHAPRKGPASDRVEGGEIRMGSGKVASKEAQERLDLSKLGSRFAKTMKVPKRPAEFLAPETFDSEEDVAARRRRKRTNPTIIFGTALIVLLTLLAIVLLLLIGKQRGLFG